MAVINLLVRQYAVCVYTHGTRDFSSIGVDYHAPVKEYAAKTYTLDHIDNALVKNYITETEYQETIAYTVKPETP